MLYQGVLPLLQLRQEHSELGCPPALTASVSLGSIPQLLRKAIAVDDAPS